VKKFKVICPQDEHTPGACSLYAGIEIYENDERGTPPHAVLDGEQKCRCYLSEVIIDPPHEIKINNAVPDFDFSKYEYPKLLNNPKTHPMFHKKSPILFDTEGATHPELPRCACSLCEKCGGTKAIFKGKIGCIDKKCEAFSMPEVNQFYSEQLKLAHNKLSK